MVEQFTTEKLVVIEYHTSDEFTTYPQSLRTSLYSFTGTPTVFFDGYQSEVGGYNGVLNLYRSIINQHSQIPSPLSFDNLVLYQDSQSSVKLNGSFTLTQSIPTSNIKLWAVITETPVQGWQYDTDWYHHVFRATDSEIVTISQPNQTMDFSFDFPIVPYTEFTNLSAVVFVQNHSDLHILQAAQTDIVKFEVADFTVTDVVGDGDGRMEEGETGELVINLRNDGFITGYSNVTVQLVSDDPAVTISQSSATFGDLPDGQTINNASNPFVFSVNSGLDAHLTSFTLNINSNEVSINSWVEMILGRPLLIVDDDGGDQLENYFTYSLNDLGIFYETWDGSDNSVHPYFYEYPLTIWFTGDAGRGLSSSDTNYLRTYLQYGNYLILTGQDIAELELLGNTFLTETFGIDFVSNLSIFPIFVKGDGVDPYFGDLQMLLYGASGANNQTSPDIIQLTDNSPSTPIFYYYDVMDTNYGIAGVYRYDDTWGYKAIYTTFGLEGIHDAGITDSRSDVLEAMLTYFYGPLDVDDDDNEPASPVVSLKQNYPNPFNPTTTISFSIPAEGPVDLNLYDSTGRFVKTLVADKMTAGTHAVQWDGTNEANQPVSSGIYFYVLEAQDKTLTRQMVLIK